MRRRRYGEDQLDTGVIQWQRVLNPPAPNKVRNNSALETVPDCRHLTLYTAREQPLLVTSLATIAKCNLQY